MVLVLYILVPQEPRNTSCQCTDIMKLSIKQLLKMMQKCAKSAGADILNLRAFEIL